MSRTYGDPFDRIRWNPPEVQNRVRWGLVEFEMQGPGGYYDWLYGMKAKRFTITRWARIRRFEDKKAVKREFAMMVG